MVQQSVFQMEEDESAYNRDIADCIVVAARSIEKHDKKAENSQEGDAEDSQNLSTDQGTEEHISDDDESESDEIDTKIRDLPGPGPGPGLSPGPALFRLIAHIVSEGFKVPVT